MSKTRRLPWGQRLRAAASLITSGAVSAARYGPLLSSSEWSNRLAATDDPHVSPDASLAVSAVWACSSLLADTLAQLPVGVFQREGDERKPLPDHPVSPLLNGPVNDAMGRRGLWKATEFARQLRGNGYCQVERDSNGAVVGLWPLRADATHPKRSDNGALSYQTSVGAQSIEIAPADVIHIRGLSHDGLVGVSPITAARHAITLAMHAERFGAKYFKNDARSGGFIIQPAVTNVRGARQQQQSLVSEQGGPERSHMPKILDPGVKFIPTTVSPEDSQFLGSRGFQIEEIARWFRVPLVLIGHVEKTTSWGTGVEQLMIGFASWTVTPLAQSWEEELSLKLLTQKERDAGIYIRLDLRGLLRGDMAARAAFYGSAIDHGWMTPNEVRSREELNPLPDGDRMEQRSMPRGDQ